MKCPLHYFLFIAIISLIVYQNDYAQWIKIKGPTGAVISCLASNGSVLYAGNTGGKIYMSTNNGESWELRNSSLTTDNHVNRCYSLAASGSTLLIGTDRGLFVSQNFGATWSPSGLAQINVETVYIRNGRYFADFGTFDGSGGLFHSSDNGWVPDSVKFQMYDNTGIHPQQSKYISNVKFAEYRGGLLAAGWKAGNSLGTFYTSDNGENWIEFPYPPSAGLSPTAIAVQDSKVYLASSRSGIFLSDSPIAPETFRSVIAGLIYFADIRALASEGPIIVGTYGGGVSRSDDSGNSWFQCNSGLTDLFVSSLLYHNGYLFAGTNGGVFRSSNNGLSWIPVNSGIYPPITSLMYINNKLFAATQNYGILVSTDNGSNWSRLKGFFDLSQGYPLVSYFGYRGETVNSLACKIYSSSQSLFVAGTNGGVYRSVDWGTSWDGSGITSEKVNSVLINPATVSEIDAGTDNGVYYSTDYGRSWNSSGLMNVRVNSIWEKGGVMIAGTTQGIYFGDLFKLMWTPLWLDPVNTVIVFGNYLYQATSTGIYLWDEHGGWLSDSYGLVNKGFARSFTGYGNNIYTAVFGTGVFSSINGTTNNWIRINTGLDETDISSLTASNDFLFAGTYYGGLWRRPISEVITSVEKGFDIIPSAFELNQNYPNPFNPTTIIKFSLPKISYTTLKIYNALGEEVAVLLSKELMPGKHSITWNATNLSSGVYFYRLTAGVFNKTCKMVIIK